MQELDDMYQQLVTSFERKRKEIEASSGGDSYQLGHLQNSWGKIGVFKTLADQAEKNPLYKQQIIAEFKKGMNEIIAEINQINEPL